jgi:hypothetical protein
VARDESETWPRGRPKKHPFDYSRVLLLPRGWAALAFLRTRADVRRLILDRASTRAFRAVTRFTIAGAARAAQRSTIITLSIVLLAIGSSPTPLALVRELALELGAVGHPADGGQILVLLAFALARQSSHRLLVGTGAWGRSLPVSGVVHRRATAMAMLAIMIPPMLAALLAVLAVPLMSGGRISPLKVVGLSIAFVAAALAATPSRRGVIARPLAAIAAFLFPSGNWMGVVTAVACLALSEVVAGSTAVGRVVLVRDGRRVGRDLVARVGLRAMGWRLVGACIPPLIVLGFGWLYRVNNALTPDEAEAPARLTLLIASSLGIVLASDLLLLRRPTWPWLRSLPLASLERVVVDAALVALPAVVATLLVAVVDLSAALFGACALPIIACYAAGEVHRGRHRLSRAGGVVAAFASLVATALMLRPWLALVALVAAPLVALWSARRERRATATRWEELHHDPHADSLAATGT